MSLNDCNHSKRRHANCSPNLKARELNSNRVSSLQNNLEGPLNDTVIQEFTEQEVVALQQVEAARAKLEAFEVELVRPE
jgi:hypothetical protein